MAFISIPGITGKVYVPESDPEKKKRTCTDCFSCQWCSDERCELCQRSCGGKSCRKKRSENCHSADPAVTNVPWSDRFPSDWPIFKGNLYFTGNNDEIIVKNNNLKWLFMASNSVYYPVVSDSRVYFSDLDKIVYCLDEEKGILIWKLDLKEVSSHFASAAGAAGKIKFPVIMGNSLFLSDSTAIYCIDKANGRIIWARSGIQENEPKTAVIDSIYADPIISGNTIYYGTRKNFIAREVREGHVVWSTPNVSSYGGFPTYYDRFIFTQSRDYKKNTYTVYCLEASSGKTIWTADVDPPFLILPPVVYKGQVLIPSGKKLFSLDITNGKKTAYFEFDAVITSSPSFTDREILLSLDNRKIAALDPESGNILYQTDFGERSSPNFVTVRDQVYAAYNFTRDVGGKSIVFSTVRAYRLGNSEVQWEFKPPFPGGASQPSASDGVLFVPAGNYLYALGTYYDNRIAFGGDGNSSQTQPDGNDNKPEPAKPDSQPPVIQETNKDESPIPSKPSPPVNLEETKKGDTVVVPDIYFEFNEAYLRVESLGTLNGIAAQLKKNPRMRLEIRGHTDNVGDKKYNQRLSEKRADAVREYLVKNGISPERLSSIGFGMDQPIAGNTTTEGRAKNRRTEFKILDK